MHFLLPSNPSVLISAFIPQNSITTAIEQKIEFNHYTSAQHITLTIFDLFLNNFTNKNKKRITTNFWHFTQNDAESYVANTTKNEILRNNNRIMFIEKTRVSGPKMTQILDELTCKLAESTTEASYNITELTDISLYLQTKENKVRVFKITSEETLNYLILTNKLHTTTIHTILGLVPRLFESITHELENTNNKELFLEYFKAIGAEDENTLDVILNKLITYLKEPQAPEIPYEQILKICDKNLNTLVEKLEDRLESEKRNRESILTNYTLCLQKLTRLEEELKSLLMTNQDDTVDAEKLNLIKAYKSIVGYTPIAKRTDNTPVLIIKSRLVPSDPDLAARIFNSPEKARTVYNVGSRKAQLLLYRLLATQEYTMNFCTGFLYRPGAIEIPRIVTTDLPKYYTIATMPNPHLSHHACFGGNRKLLLDALNDHSIQDVLAITIACNSDLNIGDSTVLREFCYDLLVKYKDVPLLYEKATKEYYSVTTLLEKIGKELNNETL